MNKHILIVDDDEDMLKSLKRGFINSENYKISTTTDGHEVLEQIEEHGIDLLITDIMMPGMDGIQLIEQVRNQYPKVRIIAMSGGASVAKETMLGMAKALGAVHTIMKPFSVDELQTTIDNILNG